VSSFEELKAQQAAAWSSAPFEHAAPILEAVHGTLAGRLQPRPGERWLDVATGAGAIALRAARAGAVVTGIDHAPSLVETARRLAEEEGLAATFDVGDAEALPYPDSSFDVVSSSMGMIFAPSHEAVAREVARVTRRGGRLGFTAWEPGTGFSSVGEKYRPPLLPPGAGDPDEWSDRGYVEALLGDAFELEFEDCEDGFAVMPAGEMVELLTTAVGPMKTLVASLEPGERESYLSELTDYIASFGDNGVPGGYLLVLGRRR
jgi:SAM-dependent methyltransferase